MTNWLKRWLNGGYTYSHREQLAFMKGYDCGRTDGVIHVAEVINAHPMISARLNNGVLEIVHHADRHFKDEFNWETSPRTNVMEQEIVDRTYH